ncbi:hypothetical protein KP004_10170 [Geomonas oryzisoli]|uniref:Uncharacterized protein n=1 Tax=Geomonas oryzisoli TaxID=2847992 RepID=A0ABX8JAR0_9BACT|nr:hypothetical protein [Geomonas oryzisoli]QWV95509.1 hypothetical protein KP004_10170 [Geomonas oryzisoli]
MTTEHLQKVSDQLTKLHGHAYFRVEEGALKECLTGLILDAVEGDLAEQLVNGSFDLEVSVGVQEGETEPTVDFRVDRPGVLYRSDATISRLSVAALEDLARYLEGLARQAQATPVVEEKGSGSNIVRKCQDHDHHEKEAAAARLKVTPQWLKSVVPCTDYSYDEIEGKKYIREYYWSRELIERLFKIKSTKTTPEDLQYVAKECCDGDTEWARDLIARLKSPNRPEQQPKDQPQKNQPQKEKDKVAVQQQAKPAGGDRPRSRSRHRKSFRHGKDGTRKPEGATEAKKPS